MYNCSNTHIVSNNNTLVPGPSQKGHNLDHQQEFLIKTIVQQKEKIVQNQKDTLKKERELSLKLRQAIQKLNLKIQM
jgi:hypothetical protein